VYRLRDDLAIVQTVDFFTPMVDDPYVFGQIAAANALSDCYAMGATPVTALNLVSYPCSLGMERLSQILRGGYEKVDEAGAVIVGGHSVDDKEPKYGLAITGVIDPRKMITNTGAKPGQRLILSKKLGTGIISNMQKLSAGGGLLSKIRGYRPLPESVYRESIQSMITLNDKASKLMVEFGVTACTDITGFGLLGHARNVADASGVALSINAGSVPSFDGVLEVAVEGTAGGGHRNRDYISGSVQRDSGVSDQAYHLMCDAQTSGGLFMAIDGDRAAEFVSALAGQGYPAASDIGEVLEGPVGTIFIKP
jgi:selenide, water dikinase